MTRHVYGVVGTGEALQFGPIGVGGRGDEVYTVPYRDIGAIVSDATATARDALPREELIRRLAGHQSVIERVMASQAVIPVKFGTTAADGELQEILEAGYGQFQEALRAMAGLVEVDIVALWSDMGAVFDEIGREPEIREIKAQVARKPPEETLDDRILAGKLAMASLQRRREVLTREIAGCLADRALDLRVHGIVDDAMITNVALLVARERRGELERRVEEMDARFDDRVTFRCVGPLPPYSFSTMEVARIGFDALDAARQTLGLGQETTPAEIKAAYRRLVRLHHPDRCPDDPSAEGRFKELAAAHRLLTDYCDHYRHSFRPQDVRARIVVRPLDRRSNGAEPPGVRIGSGRLRAAAGA